MSTHKCGKPMFNQFMFYAILFLQAIIAILTLLLIEIPLFSYTNLIILTTLFFTFYVTFCAYMRLGK